MQISALTGKFTYLTYIYDLYLFYFYFYFCLFQNMFSLQCVRTRGSDPMTVFFTSGTTAKPKMAEHTHVSYGLGHIITGKLVQVFHPVKEILCVANIEGSVTQRRNSIFCQNEYLKSKCSEN